MLNIGAKPGYLEFFIKANLEWIPVVAPLDTVYFSFKWRDVKSAYLDVKIFLRNSLIFFLAIVPLNSHVRLGEVLHYDWKKVDYVVNPTCSAKKFKVISGVNH